MRLSRLVLARDDRDNPRWKPVSRLLRLDRASSVSDILRSRALKRDPDDPEILGERSARSLSELVKNLAPVVDEVGPRRVQPPGSTGNEPLPAVPIPDELDDEPEPEPEERKEDWTEQYNSPNDYKRDKGRCPPGFICDDQGHCVKERRMMQKRRERDNTRKTFTQRQHDKLRQRSKRRREQLEDRMRGKPREDRDE